jgi:glycosyltransferase involved in cell wall biosynthesis
MRILLIMDPLIPVPPRHYGGIERVVADLADRLIDRGHDVRLWAAPGSRTRATLEAFGREGEWTRWSNLRNTLTLASRLLGRARVDVIHNFGRLAYLLPALRSGTAKIQTYQRGVNPRNMRLATRLGARGLIYTAVSDAIRRTGAAGGGDWRVVYNCARPSQYRLTIQVDADRAPLVFLGRLERCKGAHTAIDVAVQAGRTLVVAGTISTLPEERAYFERELKPRFDGTRVRYIGPVNDDEKRALLGSAAALLLPIEWDEPFAIVQPEAMLCGTPVLAFRRGGVPEVITDGVTGFVCDTAAEMAALVPRLRTIDRANCRREAERRFSDDVIAGEYEALYREASGGAA